MDKLFRQWTRDHQDQAWSLACYLLRDRAEAEDAVQEAFERLWERRESMSAARVKPWLLRVTRNLCLDRLRQRRPEEEPDDTALADPRGPAEALQRAQLQSRFETTYIERFQMFLALAVGALLLAEFIPDRKASAGQRSGRKEAGVERPNILATRQEQVANSQ